MKQKQSKTFLKSKLGEHQAHETHGTSDHDALHASKLGSTKGSSSTRELRTGRCALGCALGCALRCALRWCDDRRDNRGLDSGRVAGSISGSDVDSLSLLLSNDGGDGNNDGGVGEGPRNGGGNVADTSAVRHGNRGAGDVGGRYGLASVANVPLELLVLLDVFGADGIDAALEVELVKLVADTGEVVGGALGVLETLEDDSLLQIGG